MRKVHVEKGDFGACALSDDKPRTARIISATGCHLAYVNKKDFKNCLAKF